MSVRVGICIPQFSQLLCCVSKASLPQIPLTTLNSVVSVCKLSEDLFPEKIVTRESVAVSVGLMNCVGCLFGGMPVCHGAGGLAGQYRFGARSGSSVVFLGMVKMVLVVTLGAGFVALLEAYPASILGVMLIFSGLELAAAGSEMKTRQGAAVTIGTAAGCLALKSTGFGCVVGLVISAVQSAFDVEAEVDGESVKDPARLRVSGAGCRDIEAAIEPTGSALVATQLDSSGESKETTGTAAALEMQRRPGPQPAGPGVKNV